MAHGDITHTDIPVSDTRQAAEFYGHLFGWQFAEPPGFEGYPMWRGPNGLSGGGLAPRGEDFTAPRIYVDVDSIDATLARVVELGGEVRHAREPIDDTSWWAVVTDPDGNEIGVVGPVTTEP